MVLVRIDTIERRDGRLFAAESFNAHEMLHREQRERVDSSAVERRSSFTLEASKPRPAEASNGVERMTSFTLEAKPSKPSTAEPSRAVERRTSFTLEAKPPTATDAPSRSQGSVRSLMIETPAAKISFFEAGEPSELPALLLLPGLFCSAQRLLTALLPLAQQTRLVAVDWRGHGKSSAKQASLKDLAHDVMAVIRSRLQGSP